MEFMNMGRSTRDTFRIDLNSVHDDNRVVALMGFSRVQVVPEAGDTVVAVDEDGAFYDAAVDAVLPDSRLYLLLDWNSKRIGLTPPALTFASSWTTLPQNG
jgi:hypothetical protein